MGSPEKRNPSEADHLGGEASEGFDEIGKLPSRVDRYSKARGRAREILAFLDEADSTGFEAFEKERRLLKRCGNYLCFRHYFTVGKVRLHAARFCKQHLLCPLCAIRRGAKMLAAYLERYAVVAAQHPECRPYLVTLTVKNGGDLLERFDHLRQAVQAMSAARRRARNGSRDRTVFADFVAVVGSYEVTNKGKGWHPHVHMLVLAPVKPSKGDLIAEWRKRTGDSFVVDVRPLGKPDALSVDALAGDFCEVFKYAVKFSDLSLAHCAEAYVKLGGKRLLFSLGAFRGVDVPEDLADEPLDELPYIELFYRYLGEAGYSFEASPTRDMAA